METLADTRIKSAAELLKEKSALNDGMVMRNVTLFLRPVDEGWIMGEDMVVNLPAETTFLDLLILVEKEKDISRHRIQLRPMLKRVDNQLILQNRFDWTFKRLGLDDDKVICVEPTLSGITRQRHDLLLYCYVLKMDMTITNMI
jgi:hypothetical protein